jgi:hypothetical protein
MISSSTLLGWSYSQYFIFSVFSYSRYISLPWIVPITDVLVSYSRLIFIGLCSLLYWSLCLFFACVILYGVVIWLGDSVRYEFIYGIFVRQPLKNGYVGCIFLFLSFIYRGSFLFLEINGYFAFLDSVSKRCLLGRNTF